MPVVYLGQKGGWGLQSLAEGQQEFGNTGMGCTIFFFLFTAESEQERTAAWTPNPVMHTPMLSSKVRNLERLYLSESWRDVRSEALANELQSY